jgi:hypothetical protein
MEAAQPCAVPGEEEAPQKRIKVKVEDETMPTNPEPSPAGDVEWSGKVHILFMNEKAHILFMNEWISQCIRILCHVSKVVGKERHVMPASILSF